MNTTFEQVCDRACACSRGNIFHDYFRSQCGLQRCGVTAFVTLAGFRFTFAENRTSFDVLYVAAEVSSQLEIHLLCWRIVCHGTRTTLMPLSRRDRKLATFATASCGLYSMLEIIFISRYRCYRRVDDRLGAGTISAFVTCSHTTRTHTVGYAILYWDTLSLHVVVATTPYYTI